MKLKTSRTIHRKRKGTQSKKTKKINGIHKTTIPRKKYKKNT
jgi:hypothetical protein